MMTMGSSLLIAGCSTFLGMLLLAFGFYEISYAFFCDICWHCYTWSWSWFDIASGYFIIDWSSIQPQKTNNLHTTKYYRFKMQWIIS